MICICLYIYLYTLLLFQLQFAQVVLSCYSSAGDFKIAFSLSEKHDCFNFFFHFEGQFECYIYVYIVIQRCKAKLKEEKIDEGLRKKNKSLISFFFGLLHQKTIYVKKIYFDHYIVLEVLLKRGFVN